MEKPYAVASRKTSILISEQLIVSKNIGLFLFEQKRKKEVMCKLLVIFLYRK